MEFVMSKEFEELKKQIDAEKEIALKKWEQEFAEMKKELGLEQEQWQNQQHRQQQANLTVGIPCAHGPFQAGPVVNLFDQRWQNRGSTQHPQGGATPGMNCYMTGGQLVSSYQPNDTGQWQASVPGLDAQQSARKADFEARNQDILSMDIQQKKSFGGNIPEYVQTYGPRGNNLGPTQQKLFGIEENPSNSTQPQPSIPRTDAQQSTPECAWSTAA